jgi:DNA-binding NarL/FixJ family response regulator
VLLVDDNEAVLARAAGVLAVQCTVVGTVTDGPAALEAARAMHPDVIVLDISMPLMSGFEIASRVRETGSNAALVFFTVHDDEEYVVAARAVGAIGYVLKSRLASDLVRAVQEARARRPFRSTAP